MLRIFRFVASPLAGIAIFLLLMDTLTGYVPVGFVSVASLITSYIVAAVGGLVSAAVAPSFKVSLATATGALFPAAYFCSVVFADWPKSSDLLSFDVMWSLGLIPFYMTGGVLGRRLTGPSE